MYCAECFDTRYCLFHSYHIICRLLFHHKHRTYVQRHVTMLQQQTITHSVKQSVIQAMRTLYSNCASMRRHARLCASIRVHALQCAPMRLFVQLLFFVFADNYIDTFFAGRKQQICILDENPLWCLLSALSAFISVITATFIVQVTSYPLITFKYTSFHIATCRFYPFS